MAGRGSFIESFPLFGYDLDDYDELFAEKLELLLELRDGERVHWQGKHRAADRRPRRLPAAGAGPAADLGRRRRHAGVGRPRRRPGPADGARHHRRPARALRALRRALPRRRARRPATTREPPVTSTRTASSPKTSAAGDRRLVPGPQRDDEPDRPRTRLAADDARAVRGRRAPSRGANFIGSPQQVIEKILYQHELFQHDRFLAAVQRRHPAARRADARDRALRHRRRPRSPQRLGVVGTHLLRVRVDP